MKADETTPTRISTSPRPIVGPYRPSRREQGRIRLDSPIGADVDVRLAPSKDKAKTDAAISVFKRFASESISFCALARFLNELGWRNGCGGFFQAQQVEAMLEDPIFIGYYAWNKRHFGKFNRYADGQVIPELNYEEKGSKNNEAD